MSLSKVKELFVGRKLCIATMHGKEKVISPILNRALSVECFTNSNIDTDTLGTFTGEVKRLDDVLETARKKCLLAIQISNCDLVVASEGSFGTHPTIGFVYANDEILMLIDTKNGLEIVVRELSLKTNFNGQEIRTEEDLIAFASLVKFPSHGLIIRKACGDNSEIIKGIRDAKKLISAFQEFKNKYGCVYVETDMRAMHNPTRMAVIQIATHKLVEKITSFCPKCFTPGFGINDAKPGLPCNNCGLPTKSTLFHHYKCVKCGYTEDKKYPHGKTTEEPTFCDICNP